MMNKDNNKAKIITNQERLTPRKKTLFKNKRDTQTLPINKNKFM